MDSVSRIYCYLHMGGKLMKAIDGSVEYKGGRHEGISIHRGMPYDEFVQKACEKMSTVPDQAPFAYTLEFDLFALQPMRTDDDFRTMVGFIDRCARVYIATSSTNAQPPALQTAIDMPVCQEVIVGSNSVVQSASPDDELTLQLYGFSNRCAECQPTPLDSARFDIAIIGSGQTFPTIEKFRDVVYLMSLAGRFRYKFKRNSPWHTTVICYTEACPWKMTARAVGGTRVVQIHTFRNIHNHCVEDTANGKPVIRTKRGRRIVDDVIRGSPDYLPRQISKDFGIRFGINLTYSQSCNMKEKAKERIHGIPQFSYKLLPWLCARLVETNPGSIAKYRSDADGHFQQLFVAYAMSNHGFKMGCRSIIVIDSSHMSGPYKGALFSASSYDADDGLFPLAYGLFTSENYEDWLWFLQKLKLIVGEKQVVIISDRNQSIIRSVSEVFGSDYHAHCYRHIKENFSSFLTKQNARGRKGKENALELLDVVAYARLDCDYNVAMETLRTFNPALGRRVDENQLEHWCMSKFSKMRWDKMTSNLDESFNAWLRHERHHNICVFFIEHMNKVGALLENHHTAMQKWKGVFRPKIGEKIVANIAKSEGYPTHVYIGGSIKVSIGRAFLDVDLKARTCTCKGWQMSGIPCDHACAAIHRVGLEIADFVNDCFKLNSQELIYSSVMHPLVTHNMPLVHSDGTMRDAMGRIQTSLLPPATRRPPRRPRKHRIESQFMSKKTVHCSRCNQAGHNQASCTNPLPCL